MAPDSETEDIVIVTSSLFKVHSSKAAIFHTMAFKLSLEINKNELTHKSLLAFLKVLYYVTKIKKKKITFEQYSRLQLDGPKTAICETSSNVVFVLNSSFTSKDHYFRAAIDEAMTAFNNTLQEFGYTQILEYYDPHVHQKHPPATTPFLSSIDTNFWHFHSMLTFHHSLDTSLLPSSSLDDACRCFPLITPPELLHN